jgi:hypothetical protein
MNSLLLCLGVGADINQQLLWSRMEIGSKTNHGETQEYLSEKGD